MARSLLMNETQFKIQDNSTDIPLQLMENGRYVDDLDNAFVYIKNQNGYLKNFKANHQQGSAEIYFSSDNLKELPTGNYYIEVWLIKQTQTKIFPDNNFLQLSINENTTGINNDVISTITIANFQQQFNDLSVEILNNLPEGKKGDKGDKGDTGSQGIQGIQGERGEQGEQGQQGVQGVAGKDFSIAETFPSVASMNSSGGDGLTKGDFVMISSTVEDPDNAKLYLWNGTGFTFITDMSGATGIKGDTGAQGIQGEQGPQGEQGKQGIQGVQGETGPAGKDGTDGTNGTNGKDAVINVVTQAEYDALTDKSGVYFIGG